MLLYKAEAVVRATLIHVRQTKALQHRLCSSVMRQYNGESLELLESGLNVPEKHERNNLQNRDMIVALMQQPGILRNKLLVICSKKFPDSL